MSNRVTLAQLASLPSEEVQALPLTQIKLLLEDVATAAAAGKILSAELDRRFAVKAAEQRLAKKTHFGSVTLSEDGFSIKADLPKKVTWDQSELAKSVATIRDQWRENPADYVSTEYKVSETKYNAWPPAIRKVFEPARTVSPGSPSYKIEPMKEAA